MAWRSIASRLALWVAGRLRARAGHPRHDAVGAYADADPRARPRRGRRIIPGRGRPHRVPAGQGRRRHATAGNLAGSGTRDAGALLRDALQANTDIAGLAIAPAPAPVRGRPPATAPFVSRNRDGVLQERNLAGDAVHYWEQYWFPGGMGCEIGCWQHPFFSRSRQRLLVNYSAVILRRDRPVGLVNADVTLEWLQNILDTLRRPEGAYTFVLGSDGRYQQGPRCGPCASWAPGGRAGFVN